MVGYWNTNKKWKTSQTKTKAHRLWESLKYADPVICVRLVSCNLLKCIRCVCACSWAKPNQLVCFWFVCQSNRNIRVCTAHKRNTSHHRCVCGARVETEEATNNIQNVNAETEPTNKKKTECIGSSGSSSASSSSSGNLRLEACVCVSLVKAVVGWSSVFFQ